MDVLFAVSECAPFLKTGGLADVAGALPKAMKGEGVRTRVLMPAYAPMAELAAQGRPIGTVEGVSGAMRAVAVEAEGLDLILLDAPALYRRAGGPYLDPDGVDWADNHIRFASLSRAAATIAREGIDGWRPDALHAHDWQTALAPAYLKFDGAGGPPSVLTIHNIAFQGVFPPAEIDALGLPSAAFNVDGYEYWGQIGFLKAGLVFADRITTVSPTYARELTTHEFGMGLQGLIAGRRDDVSGVLNGVDCEVWSPETDAHLPAPFGLRSLRRKSAARDALAEEIGIDPAADAPLFGLVSRLTRQKGVDLLLAVLPRLLARGATLAVLGSGDRDLEAAFRGAAAANPGRVGVRIGYSEPLAHRIQGGADSIMVPSRFEPCGLTQLYALRYGAPPVVARTGGLADTVIDANDAAMRADCATGFVFEPGLADALGEAVDRACDAYADQKLWARLMKRCMKHPVGWADSARRYAALYAGLPGVGARSAA